MVDIFEGRPRPGSSEAAIFADLMAAGVDNRAAIEREARDFLARATRAQLRLLRAMPARRPKKWRALWRDAKVSFHKGANHSLPFRIARPTLRGSEELTALGRIAKELAR
jgi:hypothetical protein